MPIQVILKSAAQTVEDFTLTCEMAWTIAQVKDQISLLYPTKPKREHQKLIYGGKLLADHLPLHSFLNKAQDVHILHIVCPFSSTSSPQKSPTNTENPTTSNCTASPPANTSSIYPQVNPQILPSDLTSGIPGMYSAHDTMQQYMAMQQMYTQFMTQYFAQYNVSLPYTTVIPNSVPVQQQPQAATFRAPANNVNQPRQDEEEGEPHDYIDYLYTFSRIAILVAMLLFYSSISRLMAVFGMVLLLTLFARIQGQNRRQELQRAQERQNAVAAPTEQRSENVPTAENEQATENAANSESSSAGQSQPTTPTASLFSTVFALITSFFTSLIPTDPLPVNVN